MTVKYVDTVGNGAGSNKPAPLLCSSRLSIFLLFLAGTSQFLLQRLNINFAMVCMVKTVPSTHNISLANNFTRTHLENFNLWNETSSLDFTLENSTLLLLSEAANEMDVENECKRNLASSSRNGTLSSQGEFEWSKDTQGAILGAFYYGFVFTQVLGGWISDRFGGKKTLLSTTIVFSLLTLLTPIAAWTGPEYLFVLKLIQGLSHGASLPCINVISVRWCSPTERAFLMSIAYAGFSIGVVVTFPICAFICETLGWPYIFYITGGVGLLWCVAVMFVLFDSPEDHPRISEKELKFLQSNRTVEQDSSKKRLRVPWIKMLTSVPVNACHIAHFCVLWTFNTMCMYFPMFMKEVLYMDVSSNGLYSAMPYVGMLSLHFFVGRFFDSMRQKEFCSLTHLRKIFNTFGTVIPSVSLLAVVFLRCNDFLGGMIAISIGQAFMEFAMMGGYLFSVFELAPRFSGVLTGIMNTYGVFTGFLCPIFVAYMTPNGSREEWLVVFYVAAGLNVFGALVYLLFGSCELQPWAGPPPSSLPKETEMEALQQKPLLHANGSMNSNGHSANGESNSDGYQKILNGNKV